MTNSAIINHPDGSTTFAGRDAVEVYRAISLKAALSLYAKAKMQMTRHLTPTLMLTLAGELTGKTYKRGQYAAAAEDLAGWIESARAAIPTK